MDSKKLMGFESPGDQKFQVTFRDWNAMKLAVWRSKVGWDIAQRQALEILERCNHLDGCPGAKSETEPCLAPTFGEEGKVVQVGCPDREIRMSALVVLNAARQFAPANARRLAEQPYFAPSRELYSEVLSELGAAQAELEALRGEKATMPKEIEEKKA